MSQSGAGSTKRSSIRPSVCLLVPSIDLSTAAGLLLNARPAGDIDRLLRGSSAADAPCRRRRRSAAYAGSVVLIADVGTAEYRLVSVIFIRTLFHLCGRPYTLHVVSL